ncbi:MAG TPA: YbaK/EbsC family protein [Thermohalobaculum sp.]|nr:YbaK/EbsC family protein [Thermohalobaculum sp.]
MSPLPGAAQRVQDALAALGSPARVREMPATTRTAADAAVACGCDQGAIVKSLIFRGAASGQGILVLTSGTNRVHEARLGRQLGDPLARADADFVRAPPPAMPSAVCRPRVMQPSCGWLWTAICTVSRRSGPPPVPPARYSRRRRRNWRG